MDEFHTLAIHGSGLHLDGVTTSPSSLWAPLPTKVLSGAPLTSRRGRIASPSAGCTLPLLRSVQKWRKS
jgi:hypothetical protein